MNKKKMLYSLLFFLFTIIITFYFIFSNCTLRDIVNNLKQIKIEYTIGCFILVFIYFLFQGIYAKIIYKSLDTNINIFKGMFYAIVEFFFSGITPSSTGGQPIALYYMNKDNIPTRKSLIVLILNTIYFKLFLLVASILILIFRSSFVFSNGYLFAILFFIGVLIDATLIIIGYLLLFHQKFIKKILTLIYKILAKFKKNIDLNKIDSILEHYNKETEYIKTYKKEVIISLIITFLQRISLFSVAFLIYKAFGFNKFNYLDLLTIQVGVQIALEGIILPGGTGMSEYLYKILYIGIFGFERATTGMFLTRFFIFYFPLVVSLIIIIITKIFYYDKKDKN